MDIPGCLSAIRRVLFYQKQGVAGLIFLHNMSWIKDSFFYFYEQIQLFLNVGAAKWAQAISDGRPLDKRY